MPEPIGPCPDPLAGFGFDESEAWLARAVASEAALPADAVGPYELLEVVGRGAQGVVYRARRRDTGEVVALKRLVGGSSAPLAVRARFEREFDTGAILSHPNIAGVHRCGLIEDQPFISMEWIDGVPVDRWAAGAAGAAGPTGRTPRGLADRLGVFLKICGAVEHAHQRGVIHRDLKPANILVDASGEPHLVDFGLAKLLTPRDDARLTGTEAFVGTLAYAAPEQVRSGRDDVDTRTDVYALGALLYRLLTDRPAHEPSGDLAALVEAVQHSDPVRPSALVRGLDRDLDAIVARAMAKEKDRRYSSVDALSADIRRHLAGDPVEARQHAVLRTLRRAIRRHRVAAGVAAALALLTTTGLAVSLALWRRADGERARADAVVEFLRDALVGPRWGFGHPPDYTVREMLGAVENRLGDGPPVRPQVEATLRDALGMTYDSLGERDAAWAQVERALALRRAALGPEHPSTRESLLHWACLAEDRARYAEAEAAVREVIGAMRGRPAEAHALREALTLHASMLRERGALAEAEEVAIELVHVSRSLHGEDLGYADAAGRMGDVLEAQGRVEEADRWLSRSAALWQRLGGDAHPGTAMARANLAALRIQQGRAPEAEAMARAARDACRAAFGADHPIVARVASVLANALAAQGRLAESAEAEEEALRVYRDAYGDDHPWTAYAMHNLGSTRQAQQRHAEAADLLRQALDVRRRALGPDYPAVAASLEGLAVALLPQGKAAEAEPLLREALRINTRVYGERHRKVALNLLNLGMQAKAAGRRAEAEAIYTRALAIARHTLPAGHPELAEFLNNLGVLQAKTDPAAAEPALREAVAVASAALGADHPRVAQFELNLGTTLREAGRPGEAEGPARHAVQTLRRYGADHGPTLLLALESLGDTLLAAQRPEDSMPIRQEAVEVARRVLPAGDARLASSLARLGRVQADLGMFLDAEPALRECLAIRERALPASHWQRFNAMTLLGGVLADRASLLRESDHGLAAALFAEAEPLLRRGYEDLARSSDAPPLRREEALERLAVFYIATGRPERARALRDGASPP